MKIKSILFSFLMIFVGIVGAYSISMPIFETSAVSEDASVWNGNNNVSDITVNDYEVVLGSGNINTYYIYSAKGLKYFANQVSGGNTYAGSTVYLCVDINLDNRDWTPIGSTSGSASYFAGTFDGQGYSIYNMTINGSYGGGNNYGQWAGFFSSLNSATVKNLNLVNVDIEYGGSNTNIGAIAGTARNSSILNCSVSGNINVTGSSTISGVGGIVGSFYGSTDSTYVENGDYSSKHRIANSRNLTTINGRSNIGGIAGRTEGSVVILESYNEGELSAATSSYIGGLVGNAVPTSSNACLLIKDSYNAGDINIENASNVGGLLGYSSNASGSYSTYFIIEGSYNRGNFVYENSSSARIGGLVGYASRPSGGYTSSGNMTFSRVFNAGSVIYTVGDKETLTIPSGATYSELINISQGQMIVGAEYVFYESDYTLKYTNSERINTADTTSTNYSQINTNPALVAVAQLEDKFRTASFGGENFLGGNIANISESAIWAIQSGINEGFPYLKNTYNLNNSNNDIDATIDNLWEGDGTKDSPYLIYTAGDLARVAEVYNSGAVENGIFVFNENNLNGEKVGSNTITYFSLQNDIDLSSRAWTPIGNGSNYGAGTDQRKFINAVFDGNNFTISGINCSLQSNYSYLGLFGYVENSIIRNLKIDDFRFIGTATSDPIRSTLVAYLSNSYVINCEDLVNSPTSSMIAPTIGGFGEKDKVYVAYGENNLSYNENGTVNGNDTVFQDNNLYGLDANNFTQLYVSFVDTNGGTVYDTIRRDTTSETGEVSVGEVSVRVGQAEMLLSSGAGNSQNIYSSLNSVFGYQYLESLPQGTDNEKDTTNSLIVRTGYSISNYTYNNSNNSSSTADGGSTSLSGANLVDLITNGVKANWTTYNQGSDPEQVSVNVYYNVYEALNGYGVSQNSVTFNAYYNEYFSNTRLQNEILNLLKTNGIAREGYSIVGIYTDFNSEKKTFVGPNYYDNPNGAGLFIEDGEDFYIQWKGDTTYSISLNLFDTDYYKYSENSQTPKNYSWSDAIDSITITGVEGLTANSSVLLNDLLDGSLSFNYNTSDVETAAENIQIVLTLKEGFAFDSYYKGESDTLDSFLYKYSGFINNEEGDSKNEDYTEKFGFSSLNFGQGSSSEQGRYVSKNQITISLGRIVGEGTLNLGVRRNSYTENIVVDNEIYFAPTLSQEISAATNIQILNTENNFVTFSSVSSECFNVLSGKENFYMGVNLFDEYFIFTSDEYEMGVIPENVINDVERNNEDNKLSSGEMIIRIQDSYGVYHYYLIQLETIDGIRHQTIYNISGNSGMPTFDSDSYIINDRVVAMTEGVVPFETGDVNNSTSATPEVPNGSSGYYIDYYTNSSTGLIFSTENDEAEIVQYQGAPKYLRYADTNENGNYDDNEELRKIFYNLARPNDYNGTTLESYLGDSNTIDYLEIAQVKTTISFDFKFVTKDGNLLTDISDADNLPQIDIVYGNNEEQLGQSSNTRGVDLNINTYTYITFTVRNTDYYMFSHRDFGNLPTVGKVLENQSVDSGSYNLQGYDEATLFVTPISNGQYSDNIINPDPEEGEDTEIPYEPGSDANAYFSYVNHEGENSSEWFKYNYTFTMNFPTANLLPVDFDIMFVVEEIDYNISVSSAYQVTNSSENYFTDTTNPTTILIEREDAQSIKAGDSFTISTNTQSGNGYSFYGFRIQRTDSNGENYESTFASFPPATHNQSGEAVVEMSMTEFLSYYKNGFTKNGSLNVEYEYSIQALYVSKYVSYQVTFGRFLISDYNGMGTDKFYMTSGSGIGSVSAGANGSVSAPALFGRFYYHSDGSEGVEDTYTQLENGSFNFTLSQTNFYAFTGYAILTQDDYSNLNNSLIDKNDFDNSKLQDSLNEVDSETSLTVNGSDIVAYLRDKISQGGYEDTTFYIVPIIRQKTLEVKINSGVNDENVKVYYRNNIIPDLETTDRVITLKFYYVNSLSLNFSNNYLIGQNESLNQDINNNYILIISNMEGLTSRNYITLNDFFNLRVGYTSQSWRVIANSSQSTVSSNHSLRNYFVAENSSEGDSDYAITVERNWTPNNFSIYYYSGDSRYNTILGNNIYGNATGATVSDSATYDEPKSLASDSNGFSLAGYNFRGWRVFVRTASGNNGINYSQYKDYLISETSGLVENADITNYITGTSQILDETNYGLSLEVYALWTPKVYNIILDANGGTFNIDNEESDTLTLQLTYYEPFSTATLNGVVLSDLGIFNGNNITRSGFRFDGFYVADIGNNSYNSISAREESNHITLDRRLQYDILSFVEAGENNVCLTIYATWAYDEVIALTFQNAVSHDYTGDKISVFTYEFSTFTSTNLLVTNTESTFELIYGVDGQSRDYGIGIDLSFSSENSSIAINMPTEDDGVWSFEVGENAGQYVLILSVVLTDELSKIYNLGNFYNYSTYLTIVINQATISFEPSTDNSIWLQNIKYMVSLVGSSEEVELYNGFATFADLVSYLSSSEGYNFTNEQAYEYLFMKYYMIINTKTSDIHTFRNWTFNDYFSYYEGRYYFGGDENIDLTGASSVRQERAQLLGENLFLFSYVHGANSDNDLTDNILAGGENARYSVNSILLNSDSAGGVIASEIAITSIAIYSIGNTIPNYSYEVRAYIQETESGKLNNYVVNQDSLGNFYIVLDDAYMLVQVLKLENNSLARSTYYNGEIATVSWAGSEQESRLLYDGTTFYQFNSESDIYVNLNITTSNIGSAEHDTVYNFYDETNYFNISNLRIVSFTGNTEYDYINYISYFNLILDESFEFTIFNVVDTARINLTTTYYTESDGVIRNIDFPADLTANLENGLFSILGFTYSIDSASTQTYSVVDESGNSIPLPDGQYFTDDDILLFTMENNNSSSPIFYTSAAVVSVNIRINQAIFNSYIRYYNILNSLPNDLPGSYSSTTEYVLTLKTKNDDGIFQNEIVYEDGAITDLSYYGVFSDLVRVSYDMNLPNVEEENSNLLQLGQSTESSLLTLTYSNLVVSDLRYTLSDGTELSYTNLFDSVSNVFVGADRNNPHNPITLRAYWQIDEISLITNQTEFNYAVGTVNSFSAYNVGSMENEESEFFNYVYEIYKGETLIVSNSNFYLLALNFENGGTNLDNGTYTLRFTVTIKDNYTYILDLEQNNNTSVSASLDFDINFFRNRLTNIEFITSNSEITYDGLDHINSFSIRLSYQIYDASIGDYSVVTTTQSYQYGESSVLSISITKDGEIVSALSNAGTYLIKATINENYFDFDKSVFNTEFEFIINRYNIDLSTYDLNRTKNFNAVDTEIASSFRIANQSVTFNLYRNQVDGSYPEDIGEYDLYLTSFTSLNNNNFTVSYGDIELFDGTLYLDSCLTTPVGTFTITKTGDLRLYWQVTDDISNTIAVDYDINGYSVSILDGNVLVISNGETVESLALVVYDIVQGQVISRQNILSKITPLLNDIDIMLSNFGSEVDTAFNSANYSFNVKVDENDEILNYFNNVVFSQDYTLQILPQTLNVDNFTFSKEYDGSDKIYLDLDNQLIEDIDTHQGLYIEGTYADVHAGDNIMLQVSLNTTETASNNLQNYQLSTNSTYGTIKKRKANINFTISYLPGKNEFNYGDLLNNNLVDLIDFEVVDGEENLNELFLNSYYTLNYSLAPQSGGNIQTNALGFIYAGTYILNIDGDYQDFDLTENEVIVQILPYNFELDIEEGFINVTAIDTVYSFYQQSLYLETTGDTFQVNFYTPNSIWNTVATPGDYNLSLNEENDLYENVYYNGNINLVIDPSNLGFKVGSFEGTLYLEIEDESILVRPYNALKYTITADENTFIVTVENEDDTYTVESDFIFLRYDSGSGQLVPVSDLTFDSIEITSQGTNEFTSVGSYRLNLSATAQGYTNVAFRENYNFVISPREISVSEGMFDKVYDGTTFKEVTITEGVLEGDNVIVRGVYSDANAGTNKTVRLTLAGDSSRNYTLTTASTLGTISKKDATISLVQNSFQYGEISANSNLSFEVSYQDEQGEKVYVSSGLYSITNQTIDFEGSGYLPYSENAYTVNIVVESQNYNITHSSLTFNIEKRRLDFTFNSPGVYMASYGSTETLSNTFIRSYTTSYGDTIEIEFVRNNGTAIAYYHITGASISGTSEASDNYYIGTVTDNVGAYRIVSSGNRIYLLASDESEITDLNEGISLEFQYDGNIYDRVSLNVNLEDSNYILRIFNSVDFDIYQEFILNLYSYNEGSDSYTRLTSVFDATITAQSFSISELIQNSGSFYIYNSDATSSNFTVKLGKNNSLFAFQVNVLKRQVYFKQNVIERQFDNQNAIVYYENANDILTNIINGENFSLNITFYDALGSVAKYVGDNYRLDGEIIGNDNYQLVFTLSDLATPVTGKINPAPIQVMINNQTATYGDANTYNGAVVIEYQFNSETIDLDEYEKLDEMQMIIELITSDNGSASYSSTNFLNAGTYSMQYRGLTTDDFYIDTNGFVCNGISGSNLVSTFTVVPKSLNILQTEENLQTIFTKYYDGTRNANIFDENNLLRFDYNGKVEGDDVAVEKGEYLSQDVGTNIEVTFTLIGQDAQNYVLTPYTSGVINAITISLKFNKGGTTEEENNNIYSNVDTAGLKTIEKLNYPFAYSDSLTSNSQDSETTRAANFPSTLSGREGYYFSHWSLDFEVIENSNEYSYLNGLGNEFNLSTSYANGKFSFIVGNNRNTINLLNRLLNDESNNYFGLYFLGQENIEITFNAVWSSESYDVTVSTLKDGLLTTDYANVFVNDFEMPTATYFSAFAYGSTLTIRVELDEHIKVARFYNRLTGEDYVVSDNISISTTYDDESNKSETTFVVNSLTNDMNIAIEYTYKNVSVTLDLTNSIGTTFKDDRFREYSVGRYLWETTYEEIEDLMVSTLPTLTSVGNVLTGYTFSLSNLGTATTTVSVDAFSSSPLANFVYASGNDYEIVYTPNFRGYDVSVVLNLNYDENYQNDDLDDKAEIVVPYQAKFNTSQDWIETPLRTGYNFVGWYVSADSETAITGESVVDSTSEIVLYARWQIQQNTVYLTFEDMTLNSAQIDGENVNYNVSGINYIFDGLIYNKTLVLEFTLNSGFNIGSVQYHYLDGEDNIVSTFRTEGNIGIVEFNIPAQPEVYLEVLSGLNQNVITILGDHIIQITAKDSEGSDIEVSENSFIVETNTNVIIEVMLEKGYIFRDTSLTSNFNVTYDEERNVVTIELYSINSSQNIEIRTRERLNRITVIFENPSHNLQFVVNNIITTENVFEVNTGDSFAFYTNIQHGYTIDEISSTVLDTNVDISRVNDSSSLYDRYYYVEISNIYSDTTFTIKTAKDFFTVNIEIVSFDENGQEVPLTNNTAFVNGEASVTLEFESEVTLSAYAVEDYGFAGFSLNRDNLNLFSSDNPTLYVIEDNVTIYAVFSKLRYELTFVTYNYYQLNSASGSEEERYEMLYEQIFYSDESRTQNVNQATLYYGSSLTLYLTIPNGYNYYGFGFYEISNVDRNYIVRDEVTEDRNIEIYISYTEFVDQNSRNFVVFVSLNPIEVGINVSSMLDYDGIYEEDKIAGNISLVNANGESVNEYGYVAGTNNHYSSDSFNGQLINVRDFTVISYTNSSIYLKIYAERDGYYFTNVTASANITVNSLGRFDDGGQAYYLYQFAGFVGGNSVDIQVFFKAEKKIISYNFVNENLEIVSGGNLYFKTDNSNSYKVWSDGTNFASMKVTSFIDTNYTVVAYVRLGFMIDESASFIPYDNSVVTLSDITFEQVLAENSYYTYIITFNVSGYMDNTQISINLIPQTYTVLLRDTTLDENEQSDILLEIRNVKFHELLDLSETNSENLIFNEELFSFKGGYLDIVQAKDDYNFGGYFTNENGQGTQYINALGQATLNFMETGYILDEGNNRFVLSENAQIIDGQVVISLYLYWIYLKTQLTFEIIPDIIVNVDALDIVQGINEYNSWFSENSPLYLEVAFDTNVTFTAPELSGYSFYRFVIRQRDANGNWLTDVVSFQDSVPWSTNEFDRIVEVQVQIYYFAKVDVILYGGDMEYEIRQVTDDGVARTLISEGYVDTTREFTLVALDSDGYTFQYWINVSNNMRYTTPEVTLTINSSTTFFLYCQGKSVTLRFDEYDTTNGQIVILQIDSRSGGISARSLGSYNNGTFVKTVTSLSVRVGDTLTFLTSIDFGYGAEWNIDGVELLNIDENYYYFTLTIDESFASQVIQVIPTFSGESVAFYIRQDFESEDYLENATDNNNASNAGYFAYGGETVSVIIDSIFVDININAIVNMRYAIKEVNILSNRGNGINVTENYNSATNTITFTSEFLTENQIAGTLILEVIYERLYFGVLGDYTENGNGTEDNPYIIASVDDLTYYMEKINEGAYNLDGLKYSEANYRLTESLNLGEKFWTPIGTEENPFNGTFNFNGYTITSVYLARIYDSTSYGGLFGVLGENATIIISTQDLWYVFVIVGVGGLLIILLVALLIWNKKKKKQREELERR